MSSKNIKVGIDIGTYQVKVVVAELVLDESGKKVPKILATSLAESKGLRHGYIISSEDVALNVAEAVQKAEKLSGIKIKDAYISVGGIGLSAFSVTGQIIVSKADQEITELDISKVNEVCENEIPQALIQNRKILHIIPMVYKIDGKPVLNGKPLGMKGGKLELKTLFVTCLEPHLADLMEAVESVGVNVLDAFASPIVAGSVTLTKSQKIAGCVLANIGAETISIVVFENNVPISLEVFPIGSTDITHDIALGLKVSIEEAESIKLGAVTHNNVSKKKLDEIIEARLYDMFELIEAHLKKIGKNGMLPAGIFITGGGSNIGTIEDLAKATLKLPSRITSIGISEKGKVIDSTWAVAYGLCVVGFSADSGDRFGTKKNPFDFAKKTFSWFKQFLP
jgi:cell division protein FtsA